jgi:hypothetical protein
MHFVRRPRIIALHLLLTAATAAVPVLAAEANAPTTPGPQQATQADSNRKRAAELYDQAVGLYEKAKYAEAARAFYAADELAPSSDALASAMAAARLANDHLLVAQAAERAIERESADPKLAGDARAALSEAELHLARVDLACQPLPCTLAIESASVGAGRHYLLPGTHLFFASYPSSSERVEQSASLAAGSLYTITLTPVLNRAAPPTPRASQEPRPARALGAPHPVADESQRRATKPLPAWTFFSGAAVSVALAGGTIWSGIDALANVDRFKSSRTAADRSTAVASVRRTDLLLAGTALMTGLTVFAGLRLVDFGGEKQALGILPERRGALVTWSGQL